MRVPDFESVYAADPDPWRVSSSFYERRKQALVLAALSRPTYPSAWDPACGTGHLVAALAPRCDRIVATDAADRAVALTRATCAGHGHVDVHQLRLPNAPETLMPDLGLVVLAEFLYYLDSADRADTLELVDRLCAPTAEIAAVHWRRQPHDGWLSGAEVQSELVSTLTRLGWSARVHLDDPEFVLDTVVRTPEV